MVTAAERQILLLQIDTEPSRPQTLRLQLFSSSGVKNVRQFVLCRAWRMAGVQFKESRLLLIPEGEGPGAPRAPAVWEGRTHTWPHGPELGEKQEDPSEGNKV